MRKPRLLFASIFIGAIVSTMMIGADVVYNNSASMAYGFYKLDESRLYTPKRGDIVLIKTHFIDDKLLKRVVGIAGDRVKVTEKNVYINNNIVKNSTIHKYDSNGRALQPICMDRVLKIDEIFAMGDDDRSYDSRYFGALSIKNIEIKKADELYTWGD